jgi:hypothetical protein
MTGRVQQERLKSALILPWLILVIMLVMLVTNIIICQTIGNQLQQPLPEAQRVLIRTILYAIAIVTFPLTNLIRYIQLRLNQTMPPSHVILMNEDCMDEGDTTPGKVEEELESCLGQRSSAMHGVVAEAKNRYLVTVIMSMALIGSVGIFGFIMFVLGDNFNTLYIFTGMSALGLYLYRPKAEEYARILEALAHTNT